VPHYDRGVDRVGEISVAAVVETPRETTPDGTQEGARVVVVGDTDFLTNAHLGRGANADFATNAVDWLARREELITVRAKSLAQRRVHLSTGMQQALWWLSVGGVPGVVAVLGGAVAWRRRA
jgi:ABC-type uncharacterized transport system involved in gliding motility auxiliary subunit